MTESELFVNALTAGSAATFVVLGKTQATHKRLHGNFSSFAERLHNYNRLFGYSIYITVNEMDGLGRSSANVQKLRALYVDFDAGFPDSFRLRPSISVQSSPGKLQAYWLLADEPNPDDWQWAEKELVRALSGDMAATDSARILRVPGFLNPKYSPPAAVRLLDCSAERKYAFKDIIDAFDLKQPPAEPQGSAATRGGNGQSLTMREWRFARRLEAAASPQPGNGRNHWYFRQAAFGIADLGLSADIVAEMLAAHSFQKEGDEAYDYGKCLAIARNAAKHIRDRAVVKG